MVFVQKVRKYKVSSKFVKATISNLLVKDYYVFATPTMYLLDDKREILLRPNSVSHLEAWLDWYLVQGNK
jgi:hypothetical protein